jgi:hypothetical protein
MLGMQDACYAAENMVAAGRSLGLGSCFLGSALGRIDQIAEEYKLPMRVVPIVQLVMGYSGEDPPVRPRYPLEFTLFEDQYPELDAEMVRRAMKQMDEGYLTQDYYWKARGMIPLQGGREEKYTYDNYSWTEHISRKSGQWNPDPAPLLAALERRGIHLTEKNR